MIRLVYLLRTAEEIKECRLYNKHLALNEMDTDGAVPYLYFPLRQNLPDVTSPAQTRSPSTCPGGHAPCRRWRNAQAAKPHLRVKDIVFLDDLVQPKPQAVKTNPTELKDTTSQVITELSSSDTTERQVIITPTKLSKSKDNITKDPVAFSKGDECCVNRDFSFENFSPCCPPWWGASCGRCWGAERVGYYFSPAAQCTLLVNAHLASCIMTLIANQRFRRRLFKYLNRRNKFTKHLRFCYPQPALAPTGEHEVNTTYLVDIVSIWPHQRLDRAWNWRMNCLLTRRIMLEEAMAWLSTLGGAHSSLGEYFQHHAEMAGKISIKQLKLAVSLGDPLTVARCHMFWAYSLLQRGFERKAKVIVRHIHRFASAHCVHDTRLINMCMAAWSRLQHLHRLRAAERRSALGQHKPKVSSQVHNGHGPAISS